MRQTWKEFSLVTRFVRDIFPLVDRELKRWKQEAERIPDQVLRDQALASLKSKRFHCQGGNVYALFPGVEPEILVRFIAAVQTVSDYLDNLCDRAGCQNEKAFRQLHLAMTEALRPETPVSDYYALYPHQDDGGYLKMLVKECQTCLSGLPSYPLVEKEVVRLASLYSDLQSLKHIPWELREGRMTEWALPYLEDIKNISSWEFAAATGSTLGIFILTAASFDPGLTEREVIQIKNAYFPFICGLHILLDYFIDQAEDHREGDLNFVFYYKDPEEIKRRLSFFLEEARLRADRLYRREFHVTVIEGLLAMYLSDPKVSWTEGKKAVKSLIRCAGTRTAVLYGLCRLLRKKQII